MTQVVELLTDQHCGADVELFLELSDEDMNSDEITYVFVLHLSQYVRHPLEMALGPSHPHEIHLYQTAAIDL